MALEVSRTYIHLISAADGHHLRSIRYKNWAPYASGLRALMIDGRLWLAEHVKGESFDYGQTINAYDLKSGKIEKTLKLATPVRQRCRPPLASENFMYLGGLNSVDLVDGGRLAQTTAPVSHPAIGYQEDHLVDWTPPAEPGLVSIWAIAHDIRGGMSVTRRFVRVE